MSKSTFESKNAIIGYRAIMRVLEIKIKNVTKTSKRKLVLFIN